MANNSIMFDIDDPRSGKIADVMSNKTAKKILNVLAGGEKSASDVAAELGAPLNTITYNLDKLVSAGLVEKSKRFFWSSKGKRMEFYRVANKRIVISPKSFSRSVAPIVAIFLVIVVAAVLIIVNNNFEKTIADGGLKKFSSVDELKTYLEQSEDNYGGDYNKETTAEFATADSVGAPSVAGAASRSSGASDYSTTNIQVEGVDEPDFLKNDGKYIYIISGKKLVIVDAFPAEDMEILSETKLDYYASNLFLNGDKLIVFMNNYEYFEGGGCPTPFYGAAEIGIRAPCYGGYSKEETKIVIYDVSDKKNLEVVKEFSVSGNYVDARMINDYVYLISTKYINLNNFELPYYYADEKIVIQPNEIRYFDYADLSYVFNMISAVDLDNEEISTEVFMLGGSQTIYVSKDNIYLTMRKSLSQKEQIENYVEQVVLKVLPTSEADKVREIMNSDEKLYKKSREVNEIVQDYAGELEGEEQIEFLNRFSEASGDYYKKLNEELDKTIVHKIGLDEMNIEYAGGGEVSGNVLNQFSMDESDGYFRIATTSGEFWRGESENNLYVLNDDLEIVGSVEGLAEGERIYSTRFIDDRAYMVTFRQVDPLFVIDLSVPSEPRVLGYLKVTGYSGYLHPYDEKHIIGVGQEATEEGRVQGVKISLFDVSDVASPREIGKYEVTEGQYSYSDAIYDHKAFLFDKEKELLVMPVSYNSYDGGKYENWQGAFVFNVNLDDGIKLKGKIAHDRKEVNQYYYGRQDYVRRSLFMDDVLYTISNAKVKANDFGDLSEIEEVELSFEEQVYYGYGEVASSGVATDVVVE